jgi:hypothetical protein
MASSSTDLSVSNLALGFVAGALAVVTAHEAAIYILSAAKLLPPTAQPWSLVAFGPLGVPKIVSNMFWGGLLGVLFAAIWRRLPGGAMWLRGLIYGLLVVVFANWMLVPLVKGKVFDVPKQVYFGDFDPNRMLVTAIILSSFGLALGLILGLIRNRE